MNSRNKSIDELELTVRTYECLKNANIRTLGELISKTRAELLRTKNFGRKSLNEIEEVLAGLDLRLGMQSDEDDEDGSVPVREPVKPPQPTGGTQQAVPRTED